MQTIQRRLIFKTEEVVEKELIIKEKEQLYIELKRILARQPGLEAAEQLAMARKIIRRKTQQMKVRRHFYRRLFELALFIGALLTAPLL